jgi:hypothetical protein
MQEMHTRESVSVCFMSETTEWIYIKFGFGDYTTYMLGEFNFGTKK